MKKQYDFRKGRRGAIVPVAMGKTRITIRLDDDILEWFREQAHEAGGASYQTLINDALREFISTEREPLEETLRRVLREEMSTRRRSTPARTRAKKTSAKNTATAGSKRRS